MDRILFLRCGAQFLSGTSPRGPLRDTLEKALLERVSGGRARQTTLQALFGADGGDRPVRMERFRDCYGAPNEVETILEDIYAGRKLDRCTVAVADPQTFSQLFLDQALLHQIPVTFGCGVPILNSNPGKLLALYGRWMQGDLFSGTALEEMLFSAAFDRRKFFEALPDQEEFHRSTFLDVLRGLRLTSRAETNRQRLADFRNALEAEAALMEGLSPRDQKRIREKQQCLPALEAVARELARPAETFLARYAHLRLGNRTAREQLLMTLDQSALQTITEELRVYRASDQKNTLQDLIGNLLKERVGVQSSEAGKLHITGLEDALCTVRENLYLAGLSASCFPGRPRENSLLLDADLRLFGAEAERLTADGCIEEKQERFRSLVRLASALGCRISLSFAGHSGAELKQDNASSLVFEMYQAMHGAGATSADLVRDTEKTGYFSPALSATRYVGEAFCAGQEIRPAAPPAAAGAETVSWSLDREFSPTALETFQACPKRFELQYLLGLPEPEEEDPFEVLSASEQGNLAHTLMAKLGRSREMSREEFLQIAEETFARFLAEHPPRITRQVAEEREKFLEMMACAFDQDPGRETVLEETELRGTHPTGVRLRGIPDRVERLPDGSCQIVDFKTGRRISQQSNDPATCLQVMLYAYMMEEMDYPVSGGAYRYLRLEREVPCPYDGAAKEQISRILQRFREAMEKGKFPVTEAKSTEAPCRYCRYLRVCGKMDGKGDAAG